MVKQFIFNASPLNFCILDNSAVSSNVDTPFEEKMLQYTLIVLQNNKALLQAGLLTGFVLIHS